VRVQGSGASKVGVRGFLEMLCNGRMCEGHLCEEVVGLGLTLGGGRELGLNRAVVTSSR
jgi:hypothetical protein